MTREKAPPASAEHESELVHVPTASQTTTPLSVTPDFEGATPQATGSDNSAANALSRAFAVKPLPLSARALMAVLLLCALPSCKDKNLKDSGCRTDSDCGSPATAYRCELPSGQCFCRTNEACRPREFCNVAGFCQDRAGCEKNSDCGDPALVCDTANGTCLSRGRCTSDLQCALGEVCDFKRSTCVEGCRAHGDCPGTSCRCGEAACACDGGTDCALGVCDKEFCADKSFCGFGQLCGPQADAGTGSSRNVCYSDFDEDRRPYCAACTFGGGLERCGSGANYCIIDTRTQSTYCGADCSEGQSCPRGYGCRDIIVVFSRWQCSASQPCPPDPALPCASDGDCKRGGSCHKASGASTGFCSGVCRFREGAAIGFCSCQVDNDCAQESCSAGECTISRKKCITEQDCRPIRCVDFNGAGGCLIGQNCTPANGLTCLEVQ